MWDKASALVKNAHMSGGQSYAVLADGSAKPMLEVRAIPCCSVLGSALPDPLQALGSTLYAKQRQRQMLCLT